MFSVDATAEDLLASNEHLIFSRIPLYRESRDHVEGYILVRQVLAEVARSGDRTLKLADFSRKLHSVEADANLGDVLERLLEWREHAAVVVDEFGGMEGLVTLEDVLETLLGREILDELDTVADLRVLAKELRDRRLLKAKDTVSGAS